MNDKPITWTELKTAARTFTAGRVYTYRLKRHVGSSLITELTRIIRNKIKKSPIIYYTNFTYDIRIET